MKNNKGRGGLASIQKGGLLESTDLFDRRGLIGDLRYIIDGFHSDVIKL